MPERIVILGAGISGLSKAWSLKQQYGPKVSVTVIDQSKQAGGWIKSVESNGFLFELGPRSLRPRGAGVQTLKMIEQLGLQDELIPASKEAEKRYLWTSGLLQPLPSSPWKVLGSSLIRRHILTFLREAFVKKGEGLDESIYSFVSRRFSKEVAETFFDPMVSGIFAGDIRFLSIKACFPLLFSWELERGSIVRGALKSRKPDPDITPWIRSVQQSSPIFSFRRGMQTLSDRLVENLDATLFLEERVESIEEGRVVTDKRSVEADRIISCLPAPSLGRVLRPKDAMLGQLLESQPAASLVVINLGYRSQCLPVSGFGYLVPSKEQQNILGVVFDSCTFPEQNQHPAHTRLTIMMGGALKPGMVDESESLLKQKALQALEKQLGVAQQPDEILVTRIRKAIPQYGVGHGDYVERLRRYLSREFPSLEVAGNFYDGVAVNDCIAHAFEKKS